MDIGLPFPNLSPYVIPWPVFGWQIPLRWYALAYIAGIVIGWRLVLSTLRRPALWREGRVPMTAEQLESLVTWIVVGVILGGRIGYILFYQPGYYLANPLEALVLWRGGMSFHGGFLGVILVTWAFARHHRIPLGSLADLMALAAPAGLLLGRIANFINAELWGRPTTLPWGVRFPGEAAQTCPGLPFGACARHPSQLYEAALEGLLLGALLLFVAFRLRGLWKPWLTAGLFFLGYGIARFLVEFVRQPDAQFVTQDNPLGLAWHVGGWGLTMGQILSLPMILIGLWLVLRARRPAAPA